MNCPVCYSNSWKNIDHLRIKKVGMCMCESCGFVTFPHKYKNKQEIIEYYKKEYRQAPHVNNLYTGERKLQYHSVFLGKKFKEWKANGVESPVIGEVGSAYGMFLNWVKQQFPKADINGTELTESYRRVAFHEYGLKLEDELPKEKRYDMIASYHVLEHMLDPHLELDSYYDLLKDDGILYLSVPIWFREAQNSAMPGFDPEIHWAEDHVNSWSEEHLEYILHRAGFEFVYKNDNIYGNTYILKKVLKEAVATSKFDFNSYLEKAEKLFKLYHLLQENDTKGAIAIWPNCPTAWITHYEYNRQHFHQNKSELDLFLLDAIEACPNSADTIMMAADIMTRYERYEEALNFFDKASKRKPNNETILMGISNCYRMIAHKCKDDKEKEKLLRESINTLRFLMNISTSALPQAITWSYQDQSHLPIGH